jgi:hypothetical protein
LAPVVTLVLYAFGPTMENVAPASGVAFVDALVITIAPRPACGSVNGRGAFGVASAQVAA